jgi:PleD family two-component response regulator
VIRDDLEDPGPVDLCVALRKVPQVGLVTPIVVVASEATRALHTAALRAGAWDYAVQPLDAEAFILRITNLARARRDVERLTRGVLVDDTTGLYNHLGIARRAEEVEADTRRRHAALSCVVFAPEENGSDDSDVTTQIGSILRQQGRGSDVIGRIDNRIAVIAPSTDADGAARLAQRLRGVIREAPVDHRHADQPLRVRAAYCAVADFARSTMSLSEMLQRAQDALRRAPADIDGPLSVPGEAVPLTPPR